MFVENDAMRAGSRPFAVSIRQNCPAVKFDALVKFTLVAEPGEPVAVVPTLAPSAGEPVACTIEQAAHPVIPGRNLVRVALKTAAAGRTASQPLRLTLLVDQSGSMVREDRRAAMEQALKQLGGLLTKNDSVTIIGFSRTPRLLADGLSGDQGAKLGELGLTLKYLFLTHTHPDHVADIPALAAPVVLVSEREPHPAAQTFAPGTTWQLGSLTVESRSTWGHSKGGTTFVVRGLSQPVAIVGDALFASSMGGGAVSFPEALATNRKEIFTLPDDTVIAPGHGPLTTVGEEKAHNPFYPEFK